MKNRGYLVVIIFLLTLFINIDVYALEEELIFNCSSFSASINQSIDLLEKVDITDTLGNSVDYSEIDVTVITPSNETLTENILNLAEIGTYHITFSVNKYNLKKEITLEVYDKLLTDLEETEVNGIKENTTVTIENDKEELIYDNSISGEDFEVTYINDENYQALNFSMSNQVPNLDNEIAGSENELSEEQTTYSVYVDGESVYEESIDDPAIIKTCKLNISGRVVTIKVIGKGSLLTPYFRIDKNSYDITYVSDDDSITKTSPDTYYVIEDNMFEKEGYSFTGWKSNLDNEVYMPNDAINLTSDYILEAKWDEVEYNLTYNITDNNIVNTTYSVINNNILIPTLDGYYFIGWYDINGNLITQLKTGNIMLFARWEKLDEKSYYSIKTKVNFPPTLLKNEEITIDDEIKEKDPTQPETAILPPQINSKSIKFNYYVVFGILFLLISFVLIKIHDNKIEERKNI